VDTNASARFTSAPPSCCAPTPAGPELLLAQRPPGEALAGFWEFPGGKLEAGETALHAVVREVREELGVDVQAIELMAQETHLYPHGLQVVLSFIRCTAPTGRSSRSTARRFAGCCWPMSIPTSCSRPTARSCGG
jgi:8-oxo-dGTP diphosphatase